MRSFVAVAQNRVFVGLAIFGLLVSGTLLALPLSAAAQARFGSIGLATASALGQVLLALWLCSCAHRPTRQMWGAALALSVWQCQGWAWLRAIWAAPAAAEAVWPGFGSMAAAVLLNLGSLLGLLGLVWLGQRGCAWAWTQGRAGAAAKLSSAASNNRSLVQGLGIASSRRAWRAWRAWLAWLAWLTWPLAWAAWAGLREWAWWGGNYAGLSLAYVETGWGRWSLPIFGAAVSEGLGWALALLLAQAILAATRRAYLSAARWAALPCLVAALVSGPAPRWTEPLADPVPVLAVQASDTAGDWNLPVRDAALAQLQAGLRDAKPGAVLITSETFLHEPPPQQASGVWADLLDSSLALRQPMLLGIPLPLRTEAGVGLMNTALLLSPSGESSGFRQAIYAKQRLAPMGETVPWPGLLRPMLARWLPEPARAELQAGPAALREALFINGLGVGVSICHELAFASALWTGASQAQWLVNLADDGWIDSADYRLQLRRLSQLRALEFGKPLLRVGQVERSWWVDASGQVRAESVGHLHGNWPLSLQPMSGQTPFGRHRLTLQVAVSALLVAWLIFGGWAAVGTKGSQ